MVELIFDLQRFDGEGSSSGASGGGTGGSSSGGSNAKTDGETTAAEVEVWKDDWKSYSTKLRSALASEAYSLAHIVTPNKYVATEYADTISVSGHANNDIYNVNRFDIVKFVDLNLESFATFYNYTEYNDFVDLVFDTSPQTGPDSGTVTRLHLADENFTPVLSFASGLNVVYSFDEKTWFGSDEIEVASTFWNNYIPQSGYFVEDADGKKTAAVPGEIFGASRTINNYITNVDWQDNIGFYDTAFTEMTFTQKTDKGLAMTFLNGTGALVQYDTDSSTVTDTTGGVLTQYVKNMSPTFYFNDGIARVYNSKMGAWRTVEEAWADATEYATENTQSVIDTMALNTNFNFVYDASQTYKDVYGNDIEPAYTPFVASRWTNTVIYNAAPTNDIYFTDAFSANVIDVIHEDDSHFDIVFDTGAVTRIEYKAIVSPILHFADGETIVYDLSIGSKSTSLDSDFTAGFIPAYSGTRINTTVNTSSGILDEGSSSGGGTGGDSGITNPVISPIDPGSETDVMSPDLADDGLAVSYDITQQPDGSWQDENGNTYQPLGDGTFRDKTGNIVDAQGNPVEGNTDNIKPNHEPPTRSTDPSFEGLQENFLVGRTTDGFINKVTAQDDIYLVDTAFTNISDFEITLNYDIIFNFDTGKQLRVRDASIVSPVFHFADGTYAAYNWAAAQWVGVTEAGGFNNGISEGFAVSAYTDNFIRNVEKSDYIYIPDATSANVADIYSDTYYTNITFDTGASTVIRYTEPVKYNDEFSPLFIFADGMPYCYQGKTSTSARDIYAGYDYPGYYSFTNLDLAETENLSKSTNNVVWYAGDEDTVNFVDAVSTDVTRIENVDAYTIRFTFDNGTTTTIDYWELYSPLFTFADGVTLQYNYAIGTWDKASGGSYSVSGSYSVVDQFSLNKDNNNTVSNVRDNDIITFSNATLANVVNTDITSDTLTYTFDNGTTTTIEYTSYYTPVIQFADGTGYQYYYSSYDKEGRSYNAYVGTDVADVIAVNTATTNDSRVLNAGAADTVIINAAASEVTYSYISTSSYSPYIEFGFGDYNNRKYTYVYYNPDEGLTPNIVFADGTSYQYNVYNPTSAVDTIPISRANNSIVYNADDEDTIAVVDASIANVTKWGTDYSATLTFDTGKTAIVGMSDSISPLFLFADGETRAYSSVTNTWATPIYATDAADNIPLSIANSNFIVNAASNDTITIADARLTTDAEESATSGTTEVTISPIGYGSSYNTSLNLGITLGSATKPSTLINYSIDTTPADYLELSDGTQMPIYTGTLTPTIALSDGTIQYNVFNPTYEDEVFWVNTATTDNIIYNYAQPSDVVAFTDAAFSDVTDRSFNDYSYVTFTFDTGTSTSVGYYNYVYGITPAFMFQDGGTYRYVNTNSGETTADVWQVYVYDETAGTWTWCDLPEPDTLTEETLPTLESPDLWGDTFSGTAMADDIFVGTVGNTLVQNVDAQDSVTFDATLSDIVATSVNDNTIAVAFNTGVTAVIETAGTSPTFNLVSGESYTYDKQSASWKTA